MAEWINSDGLRVRFGVEEGFVTRGGELTEAGHQLTWELTLSLTDFLTGSALVPRTTGIVFPAGVFIDEVSVENEVAAVGTNATLNLGLVRTDTTTVYDVDAFLSAAPRTDWDVAGETKVYSPGITGVGSSVGTVLPYPGVLVGDWDTAAFTAGKIRVIIKGHVPLPNITN